MRKGYPHNLEELTKSIVTTNLKAIRVKFRLAIDSTGSPSVGCESQELFHLHVNHTLALLLLSVQY